jgi:V/A-type H+-transporting ATPase subunit I
VSPTTHVATRDPESGEEIPIDLDNNAVVRPFEFVTTLYGRPVYWEFDPTPFLAPFFIVFFGLCVSDGGYGIILAALTFVFMRKMQPGGGRKLMQLMFMGGLATAAVGAITGGWFGIEPSIMPDWLRSIIVMNPLEEPMKMLNVVFILGIVQIITGLAIKMFAEFKEGRWLDGILDQLVWIFFIVFLVPLGYNFILGGEVSPGIMAFCQKAAMGAGVVVVATGARKNPNPIMKVLGGVLKLYDIVGYFGDVLSYARLLALGLATGAIAMAINGVAKMASGIPVVGIVGAIVVLLGGHLFNIAVNCLGGFVHSGRLQYLEFFSKFFEGGGRAFTPFQAEKKYSVVRK